VRAGGFHPVLAWLQQLIQVRESTICQQVSRRFTVHMPWLWYWKVDAVSAAPTALYEIIIVGVIIGSHSLWV
jgi:hypothetical protein